MRCQIVIFLHLINNLILFNGGWRKDENTYYSYGMYEEVDMIAYFPKDLAVLLWEGNADHIGRSFSLSDISFKAELLSVFHFGMHKKINKKLTVGARAKNLFKLLPM